VALTMLVHPHSLLHASFHMSVVKSSSPVWTAL